MYHLQPVASARNLRDVGLPQMQPSSPSPRAGTIDIANVGMNLGGFMACGPEGEAMSSIAVAELQPAGQTPIQDTGQWFALHTRARNERVVAWRLTQQGVITFLPVTTEVRRWSDRKKRIEVPLFSCYVFVRLNGATEERLAMYRTDGIFGIVGMRGEGTAIPAEQIDAIRTLVEQRIAYREHPFLKVGQRVRVRGGAMDGVEGVLKACNGDCSLVVSIDAIQRSLAVRIEGYDVEVL